jgi:hypothetical protein
MSLIVASGVDFLVGITAAVFGVALGLVFVAAGEEDFVGEGDASDFGAGVAVASVVTETLGSCFSEAVASGEAAGDGLSSWATANGMAAAKSAVMAAIMIFIWFSGYGFGAGASAGPALRFEARIVGSGATLRQG